MSQCRDLPPLPHQLAAILLYDYTKSFHSTHTHTLIHTYPVTYKGWSHCELHCSGTVNGGHVSLFERNIVDTVEQSTSSPGSTHTTFSDENTWRSMTSETQLTDRAYSSELMVGRVLKEWPLCCAHQRDGPRTRMALKKAVVFTNSLLNKWGFEVYDTSCRYAATHYSTRLTHSLTPSARAL